jgi:heme/copper-type cytochrome/quinol oxidase subunit 3
LTFGYFAFTYAVIALIQASWIVASGVDDMIPNWALDPFALTAALISPSAIVLYAVSWMKKSRADGTSESNVMTLMPAFIACLSAAAGTAGSSEVIAITLT